MTPNILQEAELTPDTDAQVIDIEAPQGRDTLGENLRKVGAFEAEIQHLLRAVSGQESRAFDHGHSGSSLLILLRRHPHKPTNHFTKNK